MDRTLKLIFAESKTAWELMITSILPVREKPTRYFKNYFVYKIIFVSIFVQSWAQSEKSKVVRVINNKISLVITL